MQPKLKEKEEVLRLRKQGIPVKVIATQVGVSVGSVSLWCKELPEHFDFVHNYIEKRKELKHKKILEKVITKKLEKYETVYNGRIYIKPPKDYSGTRYTKHGFILRARYVVEQYLGRYLTSEESVHHKDGNKFNDAISNLEVLSKSEHAKIHAKRGRTLVQLECPNCGKVFEIEKRKTHLANSNRKKSTYCSRKCVGESSHKK